MKKFLKIGIAWIYFLSIAGLPLHSHFCGDTLTQLKLYTGILHSDDCDCNEMGGMDCCSDVLIQAQVKDQTIHPKASSAPQVYVSKIGLSQTAFFFTDKMQESLFSFSYSLFSPPLLFTGDWVQLRVYRI